MTHISDCRNLLADRPEQPSNLDPLEPVYENAIRVLRAGFLIGASIMVAGLVWSLIEWQALDRRVIPILHLPRALADGNPAALIGLAILSVMLTPSVTVLLVTIGFVRIGDRRFALLSFLVLAILTTSIGLSLLR